MFLFSLSSTLCAARRTLATPHRIASSEDENAEKIVSRHIKLLHKYNEAKDATQVGTYMRIYLPFPSFLTHHACVNRCRSS